MIFDADVFVPATDELQYAIRSKGDSYSPVFAVAGELLGVDYASFYPEVIHDGLIRIDKVDDAILRIFDVENSGKNVLFKVVDTTGALVGWQVSVCYNADDEFDDDFFDDEFSGDDEDDDWR